MVESNEKHYRIEVSNHFTAISVSVNEIGLFDDHLNEFIDKKLSINQYVNTGENTIHVKLWIPSNMEVLPHKLDCSVIVAEYTGGNGKFEKTVLVEIQWTWIDGTSFPVELEGTFKVEALYPRWNWLAGDIITDETLDKKSLFRFISDFHSIMMEKDYLRLAPLLKTKTDEIADALYIPVSERYADEAAFFLDIFTDPAFEMRPIDWDGLIFRYHAGNRLIEVVDRKGNPPIYSTPFRDDAAFGIELFLSFRNGTWTLCR